MNDLHIHFALFAEQVVSPRESGCTRRPIGGFDYTGDFEAKLEYLDRPVLAPSGFTDSAKPRIF